MPRTTILFILLIILSNFLKIYCSSSPKQLKAENREELIKKSVKSNSNFFAERLTSEIPDSLINIWKKYGKEILELAEYYSEEHRFGYILNVEQNDQNIHNLILAVHRWDLIKIIELLKLGICPECKCGCFLKEKLYATSAIDLAHHLNIEATRAFQKDHENFNSFIRQQAAELIFKLLCKYKQEEHVDLSSGSDTDSD